MANRSGRWIRRGVIGVTTVAGLALLGVVGIGWANARRLYRHYDVDSVTVRPSADTMRGEHLATAVSLCVHCHGRDLGGQVMADNAVLLIAAPNLTSGKGGRGTVRSDADLERAIRHGIRRDGTPLLAMPADAYSGLSDADLAALLGYIRSRPPVDRDVPTAHLRPLGHLLLAAGKLDEIPAERIVQRRRLSETPVEPLALGEYLTQVSGCSFCHQRDFSGRAVPVGPPESPPIPAINSAGLAGWTETDFTTLLRTGRRPDGRQLSTFMPWKGFAHMTDAEIHALWTYLQTRPGVAPETPPAANLRTPRRPR